MQENQAFWTWAEKQVYDANLNWSKVERMAGLSNGAISKRARYKDEPTEETCIAIASALKLPRSVVFRKAGKIEPVPPSDTPVLREMNEAFAYLTSEEQRDWVRMLKNYVADRRGAYRADTADVALRPGATSDSA